jgi:hypothetical protein
MRYIQCKFGWNRSVTKGTSLRGLKLFVPVPLHCSWVTETSHLALTAHALDTVQFWLKSVSNEGHFTREAKTVLRPCVATHCSSVTETSQVALNAHVLNSVQVSLKSVGNWRNSTREAESVLRPYLASHFALVTETSHFVLTVHALHCVQFLKWAIPLCVVNNITGTSEGHTAQHEFFKVKAMQLQALTGPEGSRRLRLPDF